MILKLSYNKKTHLINTRDKPRIEELKKSITQTFKNLPARYTLSYNDEEGDQIALQTQQDYQVLLSSVQKAIKINIKEVNEGFLEFTQKIDIQEKMDEIKESFKEFQPQKQKLCQLQKHQHSNIAEIDQNIIEEKLKKMMPDIVSKIKSQISQQFVQRSRLSDCTLMVQNQIYIKQVQKQSSKDQISRLKKQKDKSQVAHIGIRCDNCQKQDIIGIRYKCSVCADYDFCEECQANVQHSHCFLKIKHPRQAPIKIFTVINDKQQTLEVNRQKVNVSQGFENLVDRGFKIVSNIFDQKSPCNITTAQKINIPKHYSSRSTGGKVTLQTQEKQQKEEIFEILLMKQKMQKKSEIKNQMFTTKIQVQERTDSQVDQQKVIFNAKYLAQFGFQFGKCYQWARTYYRLCKEELLQYCLNQTEFLQ